MPPGLCDFLCRQFAVGAALGALLATGLFASETFVFTTIQRGASPELMATVVAVCMTIYCGIGATLSGFLLLVTDGR